MQRFSILLIFPLLIFSHTTAGQKNTASSEMVRVHKFVSLKPIHAALNIAAPLMAHQIQNFIMKANPLADTGRVEFHQLILALQDEISKNSFSISSDKFNQKINNYNNICQILDYLELKKTPSVYLNFSEDFYLTQIRKSQKVFSFQKVCHTFNNTFQSYKLIKTGDKAIPGNETILITAHNQLEKILAEQNTKFSRLSVKKQLKYQRKIQIINPWIESFKKGITYNATRETFFADDEMILLIPE